MLAKGKFSLHFQISYLVSLDPQILSSSCFAVEYEVCFSLVYCSILNSVIAIYVFRLPGRTLAKGQPIWVYNAHFADSRVFSRTLLAKVGIQFLGLFCSFSV